jgi:hypothetical protein
MRILAVMLGTVLLAAPPAQAAWTRPSVLVTGDDAALLGTVQRPDGSLRAAIVDSRRGLALGLADSAAFGDPLAVLRAPTLVAQVALAADGSGVALEVQRDGPSSVVAFDAAGTPGPPFAISDVGDGASVAISPAGTAVATWIAKSAQGYEVDAAFRDPGSSTFGAPVRAGYATTAHTLVWAGVGDRGEAVVAWQTNGFPSDLAAAVRLPGAGFSRARFVLHQATDARLAVGPGGQAILATSRGAGLYTSVKRPGADTMPAARRIDHGQGFAMGVAAAGPRAVGVAWAVAPRLGKPPRVRVYEGGRRIGTVGTHATGEQVGLAIDGRGAAVVSWEEALKSRRGDPEARSHLGVAYRPAGGDLRAPSYFGPVSLNATPESTQIDSHGRAWVLYEAFESGDFGHRGYRRVYVTERTP